MATEHDRKWQGTTSGSGWMHRSLIRMLKVVPLGVMYGFAGAFVLPVWMIAKRQPVKDIALYFRNRYNLRGVKLWRAVWRNHYRMMQVVIDKFAAFSGRKFEFELEGNEAFKELEDKPEGFIMLSSHVGNSELVGFSLGSTKKQMSALVYAGESPSVMENRRRLLKEHNIEMIKVDDSLDHLFEMNAALANGNIVGMPADRVIGSQKTFNTTFLGTDTQFPLGPFATAVQRNVAAVAIFMMKESTKRYRLIVRPVHLSEEESCTLNRRDRMKAMGVKFSNALEDVVKRYPEQWFNYFDFWNESKNNTDERN